MIRGCVGRKYIVEALSDSSTDNDIEVIELEERKCGVSAVQVTKKETTCDDMMMLCHAMPCVHAWPSLPYSTNSNQSGV
jgi:hypothetical protein